MRFFIALWFIFYSCFGFCQNHLDQAAALTLSADQPSISLRPYIAHFRDNSGKLSFQQIQQQTFHKLKENKSLGYNTSVHWFKTHIQVDKNAPGRWVLAIGSPELEELDVYLQKEDGSYQHLAMGYHRPYSNRPVQTRLFSLSTNVFQGMQLYFRVKTTNAIKFEATFWQVPAFTANETSSNFYRGAYFGILFIAAMLYGILGIRLRDTVMLAYASYISAQILFNLGTNGYIPVLLSYYESWATDALPRIGWIGSAAAIVIMWDKLLDLKKHYPYIHQLFVLTLWLNLFLLPFAILPFLVFEQLLLLVTLSNILNGVNIVISLLLVFLAWRRQKHIELLLYFIAFLIPALGLIVNNCANLGWLPQSFVTSNLYQISPLVHVFIMSLALALRLRQLQHDKNSAEQQALLTAQRLTEQRRFFAMLSHEFGNPLVAINRSAQMLQIKLPDIADSEKKRLTQIRNNADVLANLINNFLTNEALDNGAIKLCKKLCDIHQLIQSAIDKQTDASRIECVFNEPISQFKLDETLILIAVGNLLSNALRYSTPNSTILLRIQQTQHCVNIQISNDCLVPMQAIEKLGTPYFRSNTSMGSKGSGLGFYFSQQIINTHGGTLSARVDGRSFIVTMLVQ